jgi:molecular chaperone GrpE
MPPIHALLRFHAHATKQKRHHHQQQQDAATATASPTASADDDAAAAAAPDANGATATANDDGGASALERARALVDDAGAFAGDPEAARAGLADALAAAEAGLAALRARADAADAAAAAAAAEATASAREQYLRLSADFENFRRRTAEEKAEANSRARGDVIMSLLPLVDNFELARAQVKAETDGEAKINAAYQGLYRQLVDLLKSQGVDAVATEGAPFDPEVHEAIAREESAEVADGTVLQEFRKGFAMGGRLLRPAMVKVSFNDGEAAAPAAAGGGAGEGEGAAAAAEEEEQQQQQEQAQ